jgi:hypothetical protein
MAKRTNPKKPDTQGQDDLGVLHPGETKVINGKTIVMREYGFVEGLRVRAQAKPFLDDLYAATKSGDAINTEQVTHIVSVHHELVLGLVAQAADIDLSFILSITDDNEGQQLLALWWRVNGGFFLKKIKERITGEILELRMRNQMANQAAGQTSMPNSSPTGTTQTKSDSIPNDN